MINIPPFFAGRSKKIERKSPSKSSVNDIFNNIIAAENEMVETIKTVKSSNISSHNNMFFLQEIDLSDEEIIANGRETLNALENLRNAILLGDVLPQDLHNIQNSINEQKTNNSKLKEIMNDIEVRAAVELAKLGY